MSQKIAVIKLSAFGDFMLAFGQFKAIREHHKDDHITLITTKSFVEMAEKSGLFDAVLVDERPKMANISAWMKWRKVLRAQDFDRVYDLQNNDRTALYFHLMKSVPFVGSTGNTQWVGTVKGCDFYTADTRKSEIHAFERGKQIVAAGGIKNVAYPDLSWMKSDVSIFDLPKKYAIIIPGAAPSRPLKLWPAEYYGALAKRLSDDGLGVVIIGGPAEKEIAEKIVSTCEKTINLVGKTNFYDIAEVARGAQFAVGNDTGPTHLSALSGCPVVALFSSDSNPKRSSPIGKQVIQIQVDDLNALSVDRVYETVKDNFLG